MKQTRFTSEEDVRLLKEARGHGLTEAETWEEYVQMKAEENGISFDIALTIFSMLGPTEAFDGFITSLEDAADMEEGE